MTLMLCSSEIQNNWHYSDISILSYSPFTERDNCLMNANGRRSLRVTGRACGIVIHALSSKNGSTDVLIMFIFYINVQGKKTTGSKCQHSVDYFFLPLKVETHLQPCNRKKRAACCQNWYKAYSFRRWRKTYMLVCRGKKLIREEVNPVLWTCGQWRD